MFLKINILNALMFAFFFHCTAQNEIAFSLSREYAYFSPPNDTSLILRHLRFTEKTVWNFSQIKLDSVKTLVFDAAVFTENNFQQLCNNKPNAVEKLVLKNFNMAELNLHKQAFQHLTELYLVNTLGYNPFFFTEYFPNIQKLYMEGNIYQFPETLSLQSLSLVFLPESTQNPYLPSGINKQLNLRELHITALPYSAILLNDLKQQILNINLPSLETLTLDFVSVNDEFLFQLANTLQLQTIHLSYFSCKSETILLFANLKSLSFYGFSNPMQRVDRQSFFETISKMENLKEVKFNYHQLDVEYYQMLPCFGISLQSLNNEADKLSKLISLSGLKSIAIASLTKQFPANLSEFQQIEKLDMVNTAFSNTNNVLENVSELKSLAELRISSETIKSFINQNTENHVFGVNDFFPALKILIIEEKNIRLTNEEKDLIMKLFPTGEVIFYE